MGRPLDRSSHTRIAPLGQNVGISTGHLRTAVAMKMDWVALVHKNDDVDHGPRRPRRSTCAVDPIWQPQLLRGPTMWNTLPQDL